MSGNTKTDGKMYDAALRFLAKFLLLSAPLYLVVVLKADFFALQVAVAQQVAGLLGLLGLDVSTSQYLIKGRGFTLEVVEQCTGWRDILAFVALVVATPKGGKLRALLLVPVIYAANIIRLVATFAVGLYAPALATLAHNFLFQFVMLALIFSLWFFFYLRRDDKV